MTKIKRAKPDVAFYVGAISEGALIVKQARELGVTDQTALFGAEEMAEMELLSLAGADAIEGTYALALWGSVDPAFAKQVQDRFNAPMHYGIIFGYDALHVVAKAIESAQSLDPVKIRDALKKTDSMFLNLFTSRLMILKTRISGSWRSFWSVIGEALKSLPAVPTLKRKNLKAGHLIHWKPILI